MASFMSGEVWKEPASKSGSAEPRELEDHFDIGIQVFGRARASHAKGIIHRDIKPANIFVTRQTGQDASTSDWPSSRSAIPRPKIATAVGVVRNAVYMSPEQARGEEI